MLDLTLLESIRRWEGAEGHIAIRGGELIAGLEMCLEKSLKPRFLGLKMWKPLKSKFFTFLIFKKIFGQFYTDHM